MKRVNLSIELGTVQTGTGKVDPARKSIEATRSHSLPLSSSRVNNLCKYNNPRFTNDQKFGRYRRFF